jgi:hypothetical protein
MLPDLVESHHAIFLCALASAALHFVSKAMFKISSSNESLASASQDCRSPLLLLQQGVRLLSTTEKQDLVRASCSDVSLRAMHSTVNEIQARLRFREEAWKDIGRVLRLSIACILVLSHAVAMASSDSLRSSV